MKNKTVDELIREISAFYNEMLNFTSDDEKVEMEIEPDFYGKIKNMSLKELENLKNSTKKAVIYSHEEARCITPLIARTKSYNELVAIEKDFAQTEKSQHQKATLKTTLEKSCLTVLTIGARAFEESKKDPLSKQAIVYDVKSLLTYGALGLCFLNPITTMGVTLFLSYLGVRKIKRLYHEKCVNKIDDRINRLQNLYNNGENQLKVLTKDRESTLTQSSRYEEYLKVINEEIDERVSKEESTQDLSTTKKTNKVYQYRK